MSDNTFIPVPLSGDPIPEPVVEVMVEEIIPLEGIQDTGPRREDYVPEREQYLKRFKELNSSSYTLVADYAKIMVNDLDKYSRGEITLEEVKTTCPELKEYYLELDNEHYPNREAIVAYNYIRSKLLDLYEQEFGGQ